MLANLGPWPAARSLSMRGNRWVLLVSCLDVVMLFGAPQFVRLMDGHFVMGEGRHAFAAPAVRHKFAMVHTVAVMYFTMGIETARIVAEPMTTCA